MPSKYVAALISSQVDGAVLSNSTTPTSILPAHAKYSFGANWFDVAGRSLQIKGAGRISNIVTSPGNLTLELRFGATVIASSGAFALNTTAKTNVAWYLEWLLTLRAIGSSANFMHQGVFRSESVSGAAAGFMATAGLPASAPAVGSNFDATAAQQLDLVATFSVANSGNAITCHQWVPLDLGP